MNVVSHRLRQVWKNISHRPSTASNKSDLLPKSLKHVEEAPLSKQDKLSILFSDNEDDLPLECYHEDHVVPIHQTIRVKNMQDIEAVTSLMPSIKVLRLHSLVSVDLQEIMTCFVNLECLSLEGSIDCKDSRTSFPALKHLSVQSGIKGSHLPSLPSLESLDVIYGFDNLQPWLERNKDILPLKSIRFRFSWIGGGIMSLIPFTSLEFIGGVNSFAGYERQFKPCFKNLSLRCKASTSNHVEFIDFLKDHRTTLKTLVIVIYNVTEDQLREILLCIDGQVQSLYLKNNLMSNEIFLSVVGSNFKNRPSDVNLQLRLFVNDVAQIFFFLMDMPRQTNRVTLKMYNKEARMSRQHCRGILRIVDALGLTIAQFQVCHEAYSDVAWQSAIKDYQDTHDMIIVKHPDEVYILIKRKTTNS